MAGREFFPAAAAPGVEDIQSLAYADGQTFKKGALVVIGSAGTITECGADPGALGVTGVALQDAGSGLGYDAANSPAVVTGRVQEVSVAMANRNTVFRGRAIISAVDPGVPLQTHIGEQYGVAKDADGIWYIDFAETSAKVVQIVDIDLVTGRNDFFFKFLEAVLQTP